MLKAARNTATQKNKQLLTTQTKVIRPSASQTRHESGRTHCRYAVCLIGKKAGKGAGEEGKDGRPGGGHRFGAA